MSDLLREQKGGWLVVAGCGLVAIGALVATVLTAQRLAFVPHPSTPEERAKGVVRGMARFEGQPPTPVPPCLAHYKRDDENAYSHFNGDSRVTMTEGDQYVLPETSTIEFFGNVPPETSAPVTDEVDAYQRRRRPDVTKYESVRCLAPTAEVWIEACAHGDTLIGCSEHSDRVLITVGGPGVRAASLRSDAHGLLALSVVAAVLGCVMAAAWDSSFVDVARTVGARKKASLGMLAAGAVGIVVLGLVGLAMTAALGGGLFGSGAGLAFAGLSFLVRRTRMFRSARAVLRRASSELHPLVGREQGDLQISIPEDAPTVEGLDGGAHAAVHFRIVEQEDDGTNTTQREVLAGWYPERLAIHDRSGQGTLALAQCNLALAKRLERDLPSRDDLPRELRDHFELPAPSPHHHSFVCSWAALNPGDPLVVFGGERRIEPATPADRRGEGKRPAVSHIERALQVFHGTKDNLTRAVGRAVVRHIGALLVSALCCAGAVSLFVWILNR